MTRGTVEPVDGTWRLGRRAFLAVMGATALGTIVAGRASGQMPSPGPSTYFPPPTSVDPIGDLAFALDADVDRIFRFVADEIRYEPYAGALRGARGTLATRAGNSADQALLLAALLEAAAVRTRFATGAIDETTAEMLLGTSVTPAEVARMDVVERLLGPRDQIPTVAPDPAIAARLRRPGSTPADVEAWLTAQVDDTVTTLTEALAGAGFVLPATFTPVPMLERDDHVWVQMASGTRWLDLDPSLPGQPSGLAPMTATQTSDTLPEAMWHTVELTVIAETVSAGSLVESIVLSLPTTAADISDAPIVFLNVTPEGMQAVGGSIGGGLEGWKTYVPTLVIGDDGYSGRPFRFSTGETLFSGGGPAPDGETTAVWLQVTISAPDVEPVVVRRPVFDRVGDVARASGGFDPSQLMPIKLESLGPDAPEEYAPARKLHWLTVTTGDPTFGRFTVDPAAPDLRHVAAIPQAYQLARELSAAAIGISAGVRSFQSGANIAAVTADALSSSAGGPSMRWASDILHRSYGQSPLSDLGTPDPPALLSGVISHAAERLLFEAPVASAPDPATVGVSVGAVFEAAKAAGVGLRVLAGAALPDDLTLPDDAALRLARRLAEGWVVVLPERMVTLGAGPRTGWWLVDPSTGEAVDEMDDGRGNAFADTVASEQTLLEEAQRAKYIACMVAGVAAVVALLFNFASGMAWTMAIGLGVKGGKAVLLAALTMAAASSLYGAAQARAACPA